MLKKKRFIIAGVVLVIAFGFLLFLGFGSSVPFYNSIGELLAKGDTILDTSVQVKGRVDQNSIDLDASGLYKFTITDGTDNLPVTYRGSIPDAAREPNTPVVFEGKLTSDGIFQANKISTKCPSKYEAEQR